MARTEPSDKDMRIIELEAALVREQQRATQALSRAAAFEAAAGRAYAALASSSGGRPQAPRGEDA